MANTLALLLGGKAGGGAAGDGDGADAQMAAFKQLREALKSGDDEAGLEAFRALCEYQDAEPDADDGK